MEPTATPMESIVNALVTGFLRLQPIPCLRFPASFRLLIPVAAAITVIAIRLPCLEAFREVSEGGVCPFSLCAWGSGVPTRAEEGANRHHETI